MNPDNNLTEVGSRGNIAVAEDEIRLFPATEAARILHVNRGTVYVLWNKGLLDFWDLNGTRVTNLTAIRRFLERTVNMELKKEGGSL